MPTTHQSPFTLHNAWTPSLTGGVYTIAIHHEVEGDRVPKQVLKGPARRFEVRAPRLTLDSGLVQATYPVPGASGDLARVLPHVSLTRPTLPWEREPEPGSDHPWLALLLLTDKELPPDPATGDVTRTRPVTEMESPYSVPPEPGILLPKLTSEPVRVGPDTCRTIDLPKDVFLAVVPRLDELPYLTHVRRGAEPGGFADPGGFAGSGSGAVSGSAPGEEAGANDRSVVLANRLPHAGAYSAHLVSLEGLGEWLTTLPALDTLGKGPVEFVRLASLYSWTFTTDAGQGTPGYLTIATDIAHNSGAEPRLRLPGRQGGDTVQARVGRRLAAGYVPVTHRLPTGEHTHAWYRGPYVPLPAAPLPSPPGTFGSEAEAMTYLPTEGVFDVSYASAFALGRLLGLVKPAVADTVAELTARSLDAVAYVSAGHADRQATAAASSAGMDTDTAPASSTKTLRDGDWVRRGFEASLSGQPSEGTAQGGAPGLHAALKDAGQDGSPLHRLLDHVVADTLTTRADVLDPAALLAAVPFAHLVPDARLLPGETARFFHLDEQWVAALTAGVLSLGAGTELEAKVVDSLRGRLLASATLPKAGMLLRSVLVRDWPGLIVSAEDGSGSVLGEVRVLAPDLLLASFTAAPTTVRIRQPTEAPHFGLDGDWYVELRHLKGPDVGASMGEDKRLQGIDAMVREPGAQSRWVLDVGKLAKALRDRLADEGEWNRGDDLPPAALALELINTPGELLFSPVHPGLDGGAS